MAVTSRNPWISFRNGFKDTFTKYETVRGVQFTSPVIALCNRLVQALVLLYVVGFVFIKEKGYQSFEHGESSVVAKVKGNQANLRTAFADARMFDVEGGVTWDPADYVIPPLFQENDALFIMTRVSLTSKQVQGKCPEIFRISVNETRCYSSADCKPGTPVQLGHGFHSGTCVAEAGTCEVYAWCPIEDQKRRSIVLSGGEKLTILIKNFILFPRMKIRRRNFGDLPDSYVKNCMYHPDTDPQCPVFVLGDIAEFSGSKFTQMAVHGSVISLAIHWDCNLDYHVRHCMPTYSFRRLDDPYETASPGWSFRASAYWSDNNGTQLARSLIKATGIRIVFNVYAVAGQFDVVRFTMNLGSALGLFGMATLLCDYILFHCAKPSVRSDRERLAVLDAELYPPEVLATSKGPKS